MADIAASGRALPINERLCELWGCELELQDNGEIVLKGRPIELASESEKYRAAAVLAMALAEIGDVGFCALDGFEILTADNRNKFFSAVRDSDVNNVLVFVSTLRPVNGNTTDWLQVYEVGNGEVVERR